MNKKVVWLVNEYAVPIAARTRQIMLSQYLEEKVNWYILFAAVRFMEEIKIL